LLSGEEIFISHAGRQLGRSTLPLPSFSLVVFSTGFLRKIPVDGLSYFLYLISFDFGFRLVLFRKKKKVLF
jgi:hypothetical protein